MRLQGEQTKSKSYPTSTFLCSLSYFEVAFLFSATKNILMEPQRKACKNSQYAISFNMPNLCIIATVYSLIHFVMCYSYNLEKEAKT